MLGEVRPTNPRAVLEVLVLKLALALQLKTRGKLNLNRMNKALYYASL